MCISLCYIQNTQVHIFGILLSQLSFLVIFSNLAVLSTPQDIKSPETSNRLGWWLWIRVGDIDEMSNGYIFESDDLRPLGELVSKIEYENDRNVDIRRDESLSVPMFV